MRLISKMMILVAVFMATVFIGTKFCSAKMPSTASPFSLKDVKGKTYDLSTMMNTPLMIVYFFDVDKPPHVEELLVLDGLTQKYRDTDLNVWGITRSDKSEVMNFLKKTNIELPILFDNSNVSDRYDAVRIRPTTCIIGPNLKILDHMTGRSRRGQKILVKLAERKLQQNKPETAKKISDEVLRGNPKNKKAIAVNGNSDANMNNLKKAENTAKKLIAEKGPSEIAGKEILAKVYMRKGKTDEALKIIKEVMKKAPNRAWPHVFKGDILYSQGKKKKAEAEYMAATKAPEGDPYYIAVAHDRTGRIDLENGKPKKALERAKTAERLSPHVIQHTTLKGQAYEKEGRLDEAWKAYHEVQEIDKDDVFAEVLAEKTKYMMLHQKDVERRNQRDKLIKELAEKYKQDKEESRPKSEDTWTSQPTVLTFLDLEESGHNMAVREDFSKVLVYKLIKDLNASGRVHVVNREDITDLLQELKLGSSDLADIRTRRKLGKIFSAKIMVSGDLTHLDKYTLFDLNFMDVETTKNNIIDINIGYGSSLKKKLHQLNRQILKFIMEKYPLQAYIMKVDGAYVNIAIGPEDGVVLGTKFNVIEEQKPTVYKGKTYYEDPKPVANIEVIELKGDLCKGLIRSQKRPVNIDDKVKETIKFNEM
jgi:tetratricopeptide (TPR) repeat protein